MLSAGPTQALCRVLVHITKYYISTVQGWEHRGLDPELRKGNDDACRPDTCGLGRDTWPHRAAGSRSMDQYSSSPIALSGSRTGVQSTATADGINVSMPAIAGTGHDGLWRSASACSRTLHPSKAPSSSRTLHRVLLRRMIAGRKDRG